MSLILQRSLGTVASRCLQTWCRRAGTRLSSSVALACNIRKSSLLSSGHLVSNWRQAVCSQMYRGLQTEGDKELSEFLVKEIQLERETDKFKKVIPIISGWEVSTKGCDIKMTKKLDSESIVISFNLNHSVESDEPPVISDSKGDEDEVAHVVSKPPFLVEINKSGGSTLAVQCSFPSHGDDFENIEDPSAKTAEEETFMDQFEMNEVSLHEGELNDAVFTVDSETMDGTLYDLVMDMLDERGINEEFISHLVDFATTSEHAKYVTFLEGLKKFADTK